MYAWRPDDLIMAPLLLWLAGGVLFSLWKTRNDPPVIPEERV